MAKDHGTPGAEEVDVAVAVHIEEVRAASRGDEGRMSANGAEGADGRVDSAGKELFGAAL